MSLLEKHFNGLLLLLTGLFATVRYIAYQEMADSIVTKIPVLDSETYFKWGYQLSQGGGHPPGPFWLGPGYAQFIGWILRLTGDISPQIILVVQMFLSCATFLLVVMLTRRLFGNSAALFAGVLGILYAPWLYFDGMILSASWILFLNAVMLYLLIQFGGLAEDEFKNWWAWALAGGVCSLSAIARPSVLLFAVFLLLYIGWKVWKLESKPIYLVSFLVALIVVHLPMSLRNAREGGSPVFVTASGGVNFFIGNRDGATGVYDALDFVENFAAQDEAEGYRKEASRRMGREVTLTESAKFWQEMALRDVFEDKLEWVGVLLKKIWWTMRNEEVANNFSFRGMLLANKTVNFLPVRWGILLPLAFAGVLLLWPMRKRLRFMGLYTAGYLLSILIFFSSSEYRFPLLLILLPLAGAGIAGIIQGFREKKSVQVAVALGVYLLVLVIANAPSKTASFQVYPRVDFANVGSMALHYDMYTEAMAMFSRALAIDSEFQPARLGLANALWATKNFDQARIEFERAGVAPPDSLSGAKLDTLYAKLDSVQHAQGDSAALALLDKEIPDLKSLNVRDLWVARAKLQAASQDYWGAYTSMLEAHKLDPGDPEWLFWAAEYVLMMDFPKVADSLYAEAIERYPAYAPARVQKGFLALEVGDIDEAVRQSRELDKIQIMNDSIKWKADTLDALLRRLNW